MLLHAVFVVVSREALPLRQYEGDVDGSMLACALRHEDCEDSLVANEQQRVESFGGRRRSFHSINVCVDCSVHT